MKLLKQAAMFGIDARITISIFGSLMLVGGAALHTSIVKAQAASVHTFMREAGKAYDQYAYDTGKELGSDETNSGSDDFYIYRAGRLVTDPSISGWRGPYLPGDQNSANSVWYKQDENQVVGFLILNSTSWTTDWTDGKCLANESCYIWARLSDLDGSIDSSVAKAIDKELDDSDGALAGDFRYDASRYYLKVTSAENPH